MHGVGMDDLLHTTRDVSFVVDWRFPMATGCECTSGKRVRERPPAIHKFNSLTSRSARGFTAFAQPPPARRGYFFHFLKFSASVQKKPFEASVNLLVRFSRPVPTRSITVVDERAGNRARSARIGSWPHRVLRPDNRGTRSRLTTTCSRCRITASILSAVLSVVRIVVSHRDNPHERREIYKSNILVTAYY